MMHRHIMHHLLHVPDTEWKAAFLSNAFTWSGFSGSAALGKTPSLPGTHKWVLHVLQELFSRFSSSPIHCHPHYVCFSAGRLLPWLFYLKVEKALVLWFASLFFFFFFNISCPPQFLLLSLLLQDQQKLPPSLLPWKKDAKAHHPSSPPEHIRQTKLLLVSYSRNHESSAFVWISAFPKEKK